MHLAMTLEGGDDLGPRLGAAVREVSRQVVTEATWGVQNEIKLNLEGKILKVRTGGLLRAWSQPPVISEENGETVGTLRANSQYAAIHEYGGTIVPLRGRWLTIPLPAARSAAGLPLFRAWEVFATPQAYGFRSVFVNPKKTAIMGNLGGKQLPVPLFALKESVEIPARRYVSDALDTVRAKLPEMIERVTLRVASAMGLV